MTKGLQSSLQLKGIATATVDLAVTRAMAAGCEWLHVDFERAPATPALIPDVPFRGGQPLQAGRQSLAHSPNDASS